MREFSVGHNLTPTVKTTCYTVPTGYYAKWNLSYIVNHTGSNKTINIAWYDKSNNIEVRVLDNYDLAHTEFVKFDGGAYVVLEEGDEIRATAESGSDMSIINTVELIRKG